MPRSVLAAAALSACLLVPFGAAEVGADVVIPGTHIQRTEARVDFGAYADYVTGLHTIVAGDTFAGIAKLKLGKLARWQEIADLNKSMASDRLPVGKTLLLPPRKVPLDPSKAETEDGPKHWWDIVSVNLPNQGLEPVQSGVDVPWGPYSAWLLAVRHDKFPGLIEDAKKHKRGMRGLVEELIAGGARWLARTEKDVAFRGGVKDSDPVHTIRVEYRLTSIADGRIHLKELSRRFYDANDKELSKQEVAARKTGRNVVLILLVVAGVAGLLWLARRRRAPRTAEAAS